MKTKGLTIQEAIMSGLPFKREKWSSWCDKASYLSSYGLGDLDVLTTDWQIKVPEVTITREKLAEAWRNSVPTGQYLSCREDVVFDLLQKELGL